MTALPEKPDAVAHVSDALWEAALDAALSKWSTKITDRANVLKFEETIDHARCLILLGEVVEPVDPIDAAMRGAWRDYQTIDLTSREAFLFVCRKHFSGLCFPVQS